MTPQIRLAVGFARGAFITGCRHSGAPPADGCALTYGRKPPNNAWRGARADDIEVILTGDLRAQLNRHLFGWESCEAFVDQANAN